MQIPTTSSVMSPCATPDVRLRGCGVLVVSDQVSAGLAHAGVLSQVGAAVTMARSFDDARAKLALHGFDAVIVSARAAVAEDAGAFVVELRAAATPTFAVVVAEESEPALLRACLGAGALEILNGAATPEALVESAVQCVRATWRLRAGLPKSLLLSTRPTRQAPHSPAPVARAETKPVSDCVVDEAIESFGQRVALSPRERGVLRLMALGYRYQDIGDALDISERTVKMHAANLRRKTNVSTRYELLQRMYQG